MPVPAFTRETAITPDASEKPFAMLGVDLLPHLRAFGARNWYVFTALHLRSDGKGLATVSLPALAADCDGMNRTTLQNALTQLCALRIGGRRVLRKIPTVKFGANRYVLFPDRPDAPLSGVPELEPAAAVVAGKRVRRGRKPAPPFPDPNALPIGFADDEEEPDAPVSSANNRLLNPPQVAQSLGYLDPPQVAQTIDYTIEKAVSIGEVTERKVYFDPTGQNAEVQPAAVIPDALTASETPDPDDPVLPPLPVRKPRRVPARNTTAPACAADCVALFVELYQSRYEKKPIGNMVVLGAGLKRIIAAGTPVAEVAAAVRYFFDPGSANAARYAQKEHALNWFVLTFAEIVPLAAGRVQEVRAIQAAGSARRKAAALDTLNATVNEENGDFLPPHLRALCTEEMPDGDPFAHLWNTVSEDDETPATT